MDERFIMVARCKSPVYANNSLGTASIDFFFYIQKAQETAKAQEELQKSIQNGKDLEEKLRNIQKDFDCQRHNAESVKAALEKKIKDQVRLFYIKYIFLFVFISSALIF